MTDSTAGPDSPGVRALLLERSGAQVSVQDLGRTGWAHLGVSRSGAADRAALRRANRLVGNAEAAAGLEVLLGGLSVRAQTALTVAVSGACCAILVSGRSAPRDAVLDLAPGDRLELGLAEVGLRAYLAVRGGLDVPPVLGFRCWDSLAGLGPPPLRPGDLIPVGAPVGPLVRAWPLLDVVPVADPVAPHQVLTVPALPGPRAEWLDEASSRALWTAEWTVSADTDRVGVRLCGPPLSRAVPFVDRELPSEGLVRGAVQVPSGGAPLVFLADHPVTGGYPVVAVVPDAATDLIAQLRPGQRLRLRPAGRTDPGRADLGRGDPGRPDLSCPWWGW